MNKKVLSLGLVIVLCIALYVFFVNDYRKKVNPVTTYTHSILVEKNLNELSTESLLTISGTVKGCSPAFQIESVNGGIMNFTDYAITVDEIYRGTPVSETITIRINTGTVGNYTEINDGEPSLEIDNQYLFFLYQPGMGGGYNTEGDYYYVYGAKQGIFSYVKGSYYSQAALSVKKEDMDKLLSDASFIPVDSTAYRSLFLVNQELNLSTGEISKEEYDRNIAEIDSYATIKK